MRNLMQPTESMFRIGLIAGLLPLLAATLSFAENNTTNFLYNDGAVHAVVGDVTVGDSGTNNYGEVSNGSILTNSGGFGIISHFSPAAHNLAVVSDPGSLWKVEPTNALIVGYFSGDARLVITNGGRVESAGGGLIGYYYNTVSNNTVTVTDSGSRWDTGYLWVGGNGYNNTLEILNGATVTNTGTTSFGVGTSSSNNVILVSGSGSHFSTLGSDFGIGGGGGNRLVVANGGSLDSINFRTFGGSSPNQILITNGGFVKTLGLSFGESTTVGGNLIEVNGSGSIYTNNGIVLFGQSSSNNIFRVANGGKMYVGGDGIIGGYFGSAGAFNEVEVSGTGSLLQLSGANNYLGFSGEGNRLTISDGGQASVNVLYNSTSSNRLTVSGSGSTLNVGSILYAGFGGNGNQIIVTNGGKIVAPSTTFGYFGNDGLMEVTGSGSVYSNAGTFQISVLGGTNTLAVRNGGALYVGDSLNIGNGSGEADRLITTGGGQVKVLTNLVIGNSHGNSGFISDPGSVWDVGITLFVGNLYANNTLTISNGAMVKSGQGIIGNYGPFYGYPGTNNSVLVTGAGSVWSNTLYGLYVGNVGEHSQLRIENGGKVYNVSPYSTIIGGYYSSSNCYVSVDGAGSLLSTPNQDVVLGTYIGANNNSMVVANGGRVDVGGTLIVGNYGHDNYVSITNGGQVYTAQGLIGYLGPSSGAYGHYNTVSVSGNGSVWSNQSIYPIYVGLNGSSNRLLISNGGKVYTPTTYVSYGAESTNNIVDISGNGSLLQNGSIYVGNVTGPTSGQDAHVNVTDGGTLDTPYMITGIGGSGTISNRGGVYQFPTATPTVTPLTAGTIALSNGTISYRGVANADINNAQVGNISKTGDNTFQLNASSNAAGLASYTFNSVANTGNPTNYQRLALVNGTTRWSTTSGTTIGSGGAMLVSNTMATIAGNLTIHGSYVSDPSTNTFLGDVTVGTGGTMSGGAGDLFDFKRSFYVHATNRLGFNLASSAVAFSGGGIHTNAITGRDLGSNDVAYAAVFDLETNFAYGELHLSVSDVIRFYTGDGASSNALYIGWLDLSSTTSLVANLVAPTSINLYYDAFDVRNAYLGRLTYQLSNDLGGTGGLLLPVIPEASSTALLMAALAVGAVLRRKTTCRGIERSR